MKLSVVVPVYNEAEVLPELCKRLLAVVKGEGGGEIVLVNDGSRDRSLEVLQELARQHPELVVVELARNFGQTAALAAGIDQARGDVIVTMDGDLQHAPEEIPRFLRKLEEGFDVVSGWREVRTDSVVRRLPSKCANALARKLTGVQVKDFGSTFKAYRASLLKKIELFGDLHRFIPVLAARVGARITEIPITVHPRVRGTSNYGLGRTFGVFQDVLFLEFYSHYLTKPIRIFGNLFLLFFSIGFVCAGYLMLLWLLGVIPGVIERGALLLFSVFCMIVGIQFLVVGVLAELITRIYMHTSQSKIYSVRAVHRQGEA